MATLRVTNLTGSVVTISDVGVIIPAAGFDDFTDPGLIQRLAASSVLRTLVMAGTLAISDGSNPLTLLDLVRYWTTAGFQYPYPITQINDRWWTIQQNGGLTTVINTGFATAPAIIGTASVLDTVLGQFVNYNSANPNGSEAGWMSTVFTQTQRNYRPVYKAHMRTGPDITSVRYWFGLFSASPMASDDPAIHGMGFRYSTAVDGTAFWRCWSNDGAGGGTVTVTTIPIAADTSYVLSIEISPDGLSILFFINDVLVATHTTDLPAAAQPLGHVERIITLVAGGRSVRVAKIALSQRVT